MREIDINEFYMNEGGPISDELVLVHPLEQQKGISFHVESYHRQSLFWWNLIKTKYFSF